MEMKIPAIAITAVVVVIVLAGVLMPVLDDATTVNESFVNDGIFTMSDYDTTSSDQVTILWDHSNPKEVTVNDVAVDLSAIPVGQTTTIVATSETTLLRYYDSGSTVTVQTYGGVSYACSTTNGYDLSIVLDGTTATLRSSQFDTATDITISGPVYFINVDGDYVMKKSNESAYLKGDTEIYGLGTSVISGAGGKITKLTGSIDDGFTGEVVVPDTGFSSGEVTATYSEVNGYIDLYSLEKCDWTVTDTNEVVSTVTYSYFIVPNEVSAEKSVHFTDNQNAIFAAIPIIVIVALLIAVVALVFRGRDF